MHKRYCLHPLGYLVQRRLCFVEGVSLPLGNQFCFNRYLSLKFDTNFTMVKTSLAKKIGNHISTQKSHIRFKVDPWIFIFYLICLVLFSFSNMRLRDLAKCSDLLFLVPIFQSDQRKQWRCKSVDCAKRRIEVCDSRRQRTDYPNQ